MRWWWVPASVMLAAGLPSLLAVDGRVGPATLGVVLVVAPLLAGVLAFPGSRSPERGVSEGEAH